jgi:SAM-dependent methyltransferase
MTDWDERYRDQEWLKEDPHPLIVNFASSIEPGLAPGLALDLACGVGRHAVWLASRGWRVTAVDSSRVAIDILRRRADEMELSIDVCHADLERREFMIEPEAYDLIVDCKYLQRDLFPEIKRGVRVGGSVIAIIALADADPWIKPMNPDFTLKPGELSSEFRDWESIRNFEGKPAGDERRRAMAELVARRTH